jgi:O-glycosyl hydrolase
MAWINLRSKCMYVAFALLASNSVRAFAQTITLDAEDKGKIFQGLGAASAGASSRLLIDYPEPERGDILDYLFKPGYGAALQHLKVEVGSDVNSTDGSEPSHMRSATDKNYTRGYEWWLMEEAKKRNPEILLDILPWGSPGWVGDGQLYSDDMAKYMVDFIQGAQSVHHLHIDYVGAWNEKPYDGNYIKELARALKQANLDTKIVCCDAYPGLQYGEWAIVEGMKNDPELRNAVTAVGVHYPNQATPPTTPNSALESGKELWSSEDQPNPGGGPFLSRSWSVGGRVLAKQYISNYINLRMTKTEIWSPITSYYDSLAAPNSGLMYANTPWSGHYDVQSTIWVTAHTTQFAHPGWQYLDGASGKLGSDVSYVSFRSPDKKQWSIVLETIDAAKPTTMTFALKGGLATSTVHIWQTNDTRTFEEVSKVNTKDGTFTYTFEPGSLYSLTSTTGQGRHKATIPPSAAFPLPYREDFEKTDIGRSPRYLADQDGAFEVNTCEGRSGKCLIQQIERKPTPWFPLPNPFTLTGDIKWRDYAINVDVRVPKFGTATVMGRIESADVFQESSALNPAGYVFAVSADGNWQVSSTAFKKTDKVLASGNVGDLSNSWHHLRLAFRESRISADLDDKHLADLQDTDHTAGMIAIGSSWSKVAFSKLSVAPN